MQNSAPRELLYAPSADYNICVHDWWQQCRHMHCFKTVVTSLTSSAADAVIKQAGLHCHVMSHSSQPLDPACCPVLWTVICKTLQRPVTWQSCTTFPHEAGQSPSGEASPAYQQGQLHLAMCAFNLYRLLGVVPLISRLPCCHTAHSALQAVEHVMHDASHKKPSAVPRGGWVVPCWHMEGTAHLRT